MRFVGAVCRRFSDPVPWSANQFSACFQLSAALSPMQFWSISSDDDGLAVFLFFFL